MTSYVLRAAYCNLFWRSNEGAGKRLRLQQAWRRGKMQTEV